MFETMILTTVRTNHASRFRELINQTWTPVSDKTHIRNYRSQIVTHHGHKSTGILCAIKKKLSKYPGPADVYLPSYLLNTFLVLK